MEILELNKFEFNTESKKVTKIPIIDANCTSYEEFFETFLLDNQACLIKNIGNCWDSSKYWISNDRPNFNYLQSKYGNSNVTIQDCNQKYYNSQMSSKWIFGDYLKYWEDYIKSGYNSEMPLYYLKDWHLKNEAQTDNFYQVPVYFASDWLNEYLIDNSLDDYRFVYMGPKNTWTPLHADVMSSYSWSTNICGQKRWILFPPGEENNLRDTFNNLQYDITDTKPDCNWYEIIQNPGEAIFVPSNWYHQVWNLKDTVSINHNWINACNIVSVWNDIVKHLEDVKKEIEDCKDMDDFTDNCQKMLRASFGMDYEDFYKFVLYISQKRSEFIEKKKVVVMLDNRILGHKHAKFDLMMLEKLFKICLQNSDVQILGIDVKIESLLINIQSTLQI